MERWNRGRARDLVALTDAALPGENLTEDELVACLWEDDDPAVVIGAAGAGAAAAVIRQRGDRRVAFLQLVVVAPEVRRRGHGRALLDEVREWAFDEQGAGALAAGSGAPRYLWPGVDLHATPALCLFEAAGFESRGASLNMSFPSRHRARVPEGVTLRRVLEDGDAAATAAFVAQHWPHWSAETARAIEQGGCHAAVGEASGDVVGFGCHSVNRLGWLGPIGTAPDGRNRGVGNALLGVIATDLMAAGLDAVEVAWLGPIRFYAKAAGATVSRVFGTYELTRG